MSIVNTNWSNVEHALKPALGEYFDEARQKVAKQQEHTFICEGSALLLRGEGEELVIVGFTGHHRIAVAAPHIYKFAQSIGAKTIRCHTKRRGECRYLNQIGYPFTQECVDDEYVLTLRVQ